MKGLDWVKQLAASSNIGKTWTNRGHPKALVWTGESRQKNSGISSFWAKRESDPTKKPLLLVVLQKMWWSSLIFVDLGAFEAELWNDTCSEAHEPWRRLHVGCTILAVNGVAGNTKRMQIELETAREVRGSNRDGMKITLGCLGCCENLTSFINIYQQYIKHPTSNIYQHWVKKSKLIQVTIPLDFDMFDIYVHHVSPFFRWSCSSAIHPASVPSAPSWRPAMASWQRWPLGPSGRPLRRSLGPPGPEEGPEEGPPSRWSSPRARCRPIPARICWNACCRVCIWYLWALRRSLFAMDTSWLEADRIRKRATWIWNLDRNMLSPLRWLFVVCSTSPLHWLIDPDAKARSVHWKPKDMRNISSSFSAVAQETWSRRVLHTFARGWWCCLIGMALVLQWRVLWRKWTLNMSLVGTESNKAVLILADLIASIFSREWLVVMRIRSEQGYVVRVVVEWIYIQM